MPTPGARAPGRSRRRRVAAALALAGLVVVVGATAAVVTRDTGSDPRGDGPGEAGADWVVRQVGNGVLAANDTAVCATAISSRLHCFDARTGNELFSRPTAGPLAAAVLLEDRVITANRGTGDGGLSAFSLAGERLWRAPVDLDPGRELPVVDGVVAVVDRGEDGAVGRPESALVAVDVADGEERWRALAGDLDVPHVTGLDAFTDGVRIFAAIEQLDPGAATLLAAIVAVDPATGETLWTSPQPDDVGLGAGIAAAAPFDDGSAVAFLLDGSPGRVVVLDAATGQLRWEAPVADADARMVHAAGATIVAAGSTMRAYDAEGRELWEVPDPVPDLATDPAAEPSSGPADRGGLVFEEGRLFVAGFDVYEVDPASGASRLVRERVGATDVTVAGDRLVIAGVTSLEAVPLASPGG